MHQNIFFHDGEKAAEKGERSDRPEEAKQSGRINNRNNIISHRVVVGR